MEIKGNAKEIADFVKALQSQQKSDFVPEDSNGEHAGNQPKMNDTILQNIPCNAQGFL